MEELSKKKPEPIPEQTQEEKDVFKPFDYDFFEKLYPDKYQRLWKEYDSKYYELEREISALLVEYDNAIKGRRYYKSLFRTGKPPSKINLSYDNKIERKMYLNFLLSLLGFIYILCLGIFVTVSIIMVIISYFA